MQTITIESFAEFDARHSVDGPRMRIGTKIVWPTGAWCPDEIEGAMDSLASQEARVEFEPGSRFALISQRGYYQHAVKAAETEFKNTRAHFYTQAQNAQVERCVVPPPANAPEILLDLRLNVYSLRKQLEAIEEALRESDPFREEREARQRSEAERRDSLLSLQSKIGQIALEDGFPQ